MHPGKKGSRSGCSSPRDWGRHREFYIIYICDNRPQGSGTLRFGFQALPELHRQRRIELFQPSQGNRDFVALPQPNMRSAQFEPSAGEIRFQARGLPIRSDRAVEPIGIAIRLSQQEERRKGGSAYGARTLEGANRLTRLPCLTLGLPEQVPGPDVLRVALNDSRECRACLRIIAAAYPSVGGDHAPIGAFGIPALPLLGITQEPVPI